MTVIAGNDGVYLHKIASVGDVAIGYLLIKKDGSFLRPADEIPSHMPKMKDDVEEEIPALETKSLGKFTDDELNMYMESTRKMIRRMYKIIKGV